MKVHSGRTIADRRCVKQQRQHEPHHWYDATWDVWCKCDGRQVEAIKEAALILPPGSEMCV